MQLYGLILGLALSLLAVGSAAAQDATQQRRPQRRADVNAAYMGGGMVVEAPLIGRRPQPVTTRTEIAPMPNNGIEGPRVFQQTDSVRVTPGMIAPQLPGRGLAQENGSPGSLQDRLFRPAPGAHLRIPMSW